MIKNRVCIILHGFLLAFVLVSLLVWVVPISTAGADTIVNFPDPNLQAAIRQAIGKPTGDIYQSDLVGLTTLNANNRGITDLTGLEWCTSLTNLGLGSNQIGNISQLSGLTSLTALDLDSNQIGNISPLSSLTSMTSLYLYSNQIRDVSPLSGLTSLSKLYLCFNQIGNISPLSSLTSLTLLRLVSNQLSDISLLSGLTSLTGLYLSSNQISDIEPLVSNLGLAQGDTVDLGNNPLSSYSINVYIPQLQARGVQLLYDAATPVTGVTREVNGDILPGVSITLDSIGPVVSDQDGYYEIMGNATGSHTVVAHKDGFRDRTQIVNIAGLGPGYALTCNFQGQYALIPNAPAIWYALDCVNLWLYPPNPQTGLDIWTALDVINAWLYPVAPTPTPTPTPSPTPTPAPPQADFVGNPTVCNGPTTVSFTDQSTGEITSWSWDFGDGHTSSLQNPTNYYNHNGYYTISLTVTGLWGTDTETKPSYIYVYGCPT